MVGGRGWAQRDPSELGQLFPSGLSGLWIRGRDWGWRASSCYSTHEGGVRKGAIKTHIWMTSNRGLSKGRSSGTGPATPSQRGGGIDASTHLSCWPQAWLLPVMVGRTEDTPSRSCLVWTLGHVFRHKLHGLALLNRLCPLAPTDGWRVAGKGDRPGASC